MRVLIVEDDEVVRRSLRRGLEADGYCVDVADDGVEGLYLVRERSYDAVILDLLLPGLNGYQLCKEMRDEGVDVPVMILTAKSGSWDEAEGLDTGADDYLVKPFQYPVLLARLRALLRRGPSRLGPVLVHGAITIDPGRHRCTRDGIEVGLTPREFALLHYLLAEPDLTHTNQDLLHHVWGETDADHNVVQVYVSALRRKLDEPGRPSFLETVRGVGYRLSDER